MEQVKVFNLSNDCSRLEYEINNWLSNNKVEVISRELTSAAGIGLGGGAIRKLYMRNILPCGCK